MSATAISAVVARRPTTLAGWVTSLAAYVRPWVRLDIEFCDGTGTITLRFLGRTEIPGLVIGCYLTVEGTPWMDSDTLVILNPLYMFLDDDIRTHCKLPNHRAEESRVEADGA
jgi:hypothetical protein